MTNINSKKYLKNHPLDIWRNKEVTGLLLDFFIGNFTQGGISQCLAENLVLTAWENRKTLDKETLRRECDRLFRLAKKEYFYKITETLPLSLIDLSGVSSFLDVGANKLTAINYFAEKYPVIKELIGVDIVPQKKVFIDSLRSKYFQISSAADILPVEENSIDFINIQFVFHHFTDLESIVKMLSLCKRALKSDGTLLLWEESFAEKIDQNKLNENKERGIEIDDELTQKFYALDERMRWEFIVVNDWIINVSNVHMPWTGEYYTWSEWELILAKSGFTLSKEYDFGLRKNGLLKQGVHMQGYFKKN
ncbi:MAG: class I SAM-dependent methyltransferase [Candidatus Falkowbacteria bacterium]|nr:class I SAM-dependent methyltransferase [Candidatus Falkowbacteria bacterium]